MSSNNSGNSTGIAQQQGSSLSSFIASLVTNTAIWGIEIALFIILRTVFKRIYEPRTFVETVPEQKRVDPLPRTPWSWIPKLLKTPTNLVISKSGLDGYFLLRYLRGMMCLFGGAMLIIWPVLLPINAVNQRGEDGGVTGMDLLSISNVKNPSRYWAQVVMAIGFIGAVCWFMYHELEAFIRIRQENLTAEEHRNTVRATTILVTSIPDNFLNDKTLRQVFSVFPGGVKNVFLNRDCSDLLDKVKERDTMAKLLESAETELIINANKNEAKERKRKENKRAKEEKKAKKKAPQSTSSEQSDAFEMEQRKSDGGAEDGKSGQQNEKVAERDRTVNRDKLNESDDEAREHEREDRNHAEQIHAGEYLADQWVPKKKRPTYRIPIFKWMPSLPLIGKKVDTIKWAREELAKLNLAIAREQARPERFDAMNSAFIQFNTQLAAHMACQSVASHRVMFLAPRFLETAPEDVVWDNMQLVWWQRLIRVYAINTAIVALIIFYAIPTAFVGTISNITYLTNKLPWLNFIYRLPDKLLGIVTGLLPAVMLALWLAILPFILRIACRYQGHPTRTVIELAVQKLYFAFLVVQLFLVVSIASSTTAVITQLIDNPTSVANLLATNLPKSSNFFFSYLLLQGLSVSAGTLLQIVVLILFFILTKLDSTPRTMWARFNSLPGLGWGTTYPVFTNLAVIGISYAIISPLIMIFVVVTFFLFYFTYLHNFLYVYEFTTDTGGLSFPTALFQTMTGLYFGEICLIGLFFITSGARPQGIVMVVVLALTILYHLQLSSSFAPLIQYLPIDIQEELYAQVQEQKVAEGRKPDEEAEFRQQKIGPRGIGDTSPAPTRQPEMPSQIPRSDGIRNLDEKVQERTGDPTNVDENKLDPASQSDGRFMTKLRDVKNIGRKVQIPGLSKKKPEELDENELINIDLQRKFTHELTDEELTAIAFQHEALRARPPILWIPEDELGVARDEIYHTQLETHEGIGMTCEGARLNEKFKIVWYGNPPDYIHIPSI